MTMRFAACFGTGNPATLSKAYLHLSIHSSIKQERQPGLAAFLKVFLESSFAHGEFQRIFPFWERDIKGRLE